MSQVTLDRNSRILLTGASGMVGKAVWRALQARGCDQVLAPGRGDLDLLDRDCVDRYLNRHRPDYVFLVAARVGGIAANMADPVGFLSDNVRMATNGLEMCHRYAVGKVLFLGSSCIYPRACPQPMTEDRLMTGPLEPTNEGYALAKIVGVRLAQAYRNQHGLRTICAMPSNIYGTGDHFELDRSHVLSALVRRFVEAQESNAPAVTLWGTGAARRELIHVDDVAAALIFLFEHYDDPDIINVGTGTDVSIRELAELTASEVGYTGLLEWDSTKPDGMPRKCLDVTRLSALGFSSRITLSEGLKRTVEEYRAIRREQVGQ